MMLRPILEQNRFGFVSELGTFDGNWICSRHLRGSVTITTSVEDDRVVSLKKLKVLKTFGQLQYDHRSVDGIVLIDVVSLTVCDTYS